MRTCCFESEQPLASNRLRKRCFAEVIEKTDWQLACFRVHRQFISFPRILATAVSVPPVAQSNELPPYALVSRKVLPMNVKRMMCRFLFIVFVVGCRTAEAQTDEPRDQLFSTIQSLDAKLFEAYNHCDLATLGTMVSDDLEFYHDQTVFRLGRLRSSRPLNRTSAVRWSELCSPTRSRCTHSRDMGQWRSEFIASTTQRIPKMVWAMPSS